MTRNQARISGKQAEGNTWQRAARLSLVWIAALLLAISAWFILKHISTLGVFRVGGFLALGAVHFILPLALERGLVLAGLERKWRYRLAFVISAALPVFYCTYVRVGWIFRSSPSESPVPDQGTTGLGLVVSVVCAFAGSLLATWVNQGVWENNSPPVESVQIDVYQRHLAVIGKPYPPPRAKRYFDYCMACIGLVFSAPVWILCTFLIWLEDPGPILFVKNSVGVGGVNFHQFKFRTMVCGAEENTGPVLSQQEDERVLAFGHFLRKTALDELPQLINILLGEMSFVGPRPQRTVLVQDYLREMPEYAERHRVLPGLAGLAQVAGDYYLTPRQKLRFDRLYIRYIGLGFDIKLMFLAFLITFWFRWRKDWNGRLPRKLVRFGGVGVESKT